MCVWSHISSRKVGLWETGSGSRITRFNHTRITRQVMWTVEDSSRQDHTEEDTVWGSSGNMCSITRQVPRLGHHSVSEACTSQCARFCALSTLRMCTQVSTLRLCTQVPTLHMCTQEPIMCMWTQEPTLCMCIQEPIMCVCTQVSHEHNVQCSLSVCIPSVYGFWRRRVHIAQFSIYLVCM